MTVPPAEGPVLGKRAVTTALGENWKKSSLADEKAPYSPATDNDTRTGCKEAGETQDICVEETTLADGPSRSPKKHLAEPENPEPETETRSPPIVEPKLGEELVITIDSATYRKLLRDLSSPGLSRSPFCRS
jgi:hypothetical protein